MRRTIKFAGIKFEEFRIHLATSRLALIGMLTLLCLVAGCVGGGAQPPPPAVLVAMSPTAPTVDQGGTQNFTATVTGTTNTAITWSVQEGAAGGAITSAGAYTAPQAAGTFHVIATSQADTTKTATATVTVPAVTVAVSPNAATVFAGAMSPFTAMVTGTINPAVTWAVQEGAAGGTITSAGVYTAPQTIGTFHIIATSQADSTKSATATIAVPPVSVAIDPSSDTLGPKGLRTFVATVGGTNNTAVTWNVQEGAAGGTIDANGDYVAPTTQGTFHVVSTSVADPSASAVAIVTAVQSGFLPTGSMTTPRSAQTATLLNTGKVLFAGGSTGVTCDSDGDCADGVTATAELFDPATGAFTATAGMSVSRAAHTATLLQDGKVLVAGGYFVLSAFGLPVGVVQTAEIFDPSTATFTLTGQMTVAREFHSATLLPSGKVLVTGGTSFVLAGSPSAELFDPATGTFTATGSMAVGRLTPTLTLLQDGKVLVTGGLDSSDKATSTAELYDPTSGTFTPTGSMTTPRESHSATLLPNGTVLIVGGDEGGKALTSAEIYDPATGTFTPTGSMETAHGGEATLLHSGKVLVAGGSGSTFVAELFDPGTGTFSLTGSMGTQRTRHTATLLPNGDVLVTGGFGAIGVEIASAEIYH